MNRNESPVNLDLPIRFNEPSNANLHTRAEPRPQIRPEEVDFYDSWIDVQAESLSATPETRSKKQYFSMAASVVVDRAAEIEIDQASEDANIAHPSDPIVSQATESNAPTANARAPKYIRKLANSSLNSAAD
jgi:hypothetical protein